ncbi:hypothetical protein AVEN_258230-1 [Araneus ventricosus]|uniref:Uncharacterized protein n=1 Tax=Araneus ventricosus TaxID=182803 RepID=A0A4Y2MLB1_ARAVE|nr:hypothetical protein AVEN_258230-1 [Araneus ventricosus]
MSSRHANILYVTAVIIGHCHAGQHSIAAEPIPRHRHRRLVTSADIPAVTSLLTLQAEFLNPGSELQAGSDLHGSSELQQALDPPGF